MEFINQKTKQQQKKTKSLKRLESFELVLIYVIVYLMYVCICLRPSLLPPPLQMLISSIDSIKICAHHGKERDREGTLSGLIFLSPDLIFIFVSAVSFLVTSIIACVVNVESI